MFCPQCNQAMPDGSKFCMNCGAKFNANTQPISTPVTQTPTMPTKPMEPVAPHPLSAPMNVPTVPPTAVSQPPISQAPMQQPPVSQVPMQMPTQQSMSQQFGQQSFQQPLTPSSPTIPTAYNSFQASAERNWLEKLGSKIPGLSGYQEKETRREVDKLHREHLATMLFQLKAPINSVVRELSDNRRLFEVGPIERALQKLDKIENRIRYASYGYTGFFDVVKIQEAQLDQLYHFDLALVADVDLIKAHVEQLQAKIDDAKSLKAAAQALDKALEELDHKFNQRYQAIENPAWSPY